MWDAAADGYTRGKGFSAIFLKTLSQAILDGAHIECIVRETGVDSDDKTPGISAKLPSPLPVARWRKPRHHNPELRVAVTAYPGHVLAVTSLTLDITGGRCIKG